MNYTTKSRELGREATFYFMETDANGYPNCENWKPIFAKSISGAKKAAVRNQFFQGTTLWLADNNKRIIAVRRADALNMNLHYKWEELTELAE
jgi:hypothetical protein